MTPCFSAKVPLGAICKIWHRGGLPGEEDAKRIQGFPNQWGIYNKYPSFIDNEDITCMWVRN
jgi:hypothetical protein